MSKKKTVSEPTVYKDEEEKAYRDSLAAPVEEKAVEEEVDDTEEVEDSEKE